MLVIPKAKVDKKLRERFGGVIESRIDRGSLLLEGAVPSWNDKIEVGWAAARFGYRGVVNDLKVPGIADEALEPPPLRDGALEGAYFDVAIVGGGVIGAALARELARWELSIVVLEKEYDLAVHTSGRNDGMIHDGFAARPGTKKAGYNVRGNRLWEPLCRELGIEFKRPGSLVIFRGRTSAIAYPLMVARAKENEVDGWEYWSRARLRAEEPNVRPDQHGAFFLPSAGVLSPYKATIALAENAAENGVRFSFDTCVLSMDLEDGRVSSLRTNRGTFRAGVVVNAAGNWPTR